MRIGILGCSFSRLKGINADISTWPELLAAQCDATIYNMSIFGNSCDNQIYQLQKYKDFFDAYIVQLSPASRKTYVEKENIYHNQIFSVKRLQDNYFELDDLFSGAEGSFKNTNMVNYTVSYAEKYKSNEVAKNYLFDFKHNISSYNFKYHDMCSIYIKHLLKDIPHIIFSQKKDYEQNFDFCVQDRLTKKEWNNFIIDNGCHFNTSGHQFITDIVKEKMTSWI